MNDLNPSDRAVLREPEAAVRDRELLELAAFAAGLQGFEPCECCAALVSCVAGEAPVYWNPLTNDGDALRLAVKLRLMVSGKGKVITDGVHVQSDCDVHMECVKPGSDAYAATRRAIVRAAAAIGSELSKTASGCSYTARSDGAKE